MEDMELTRLQTAQAAVVAQLEMERVKAEVDGDEWTVRNLNREIVAAASLARLVHRAPR
jgi:hypothetical protein